VTVILYRLQKRDAVYSITFEPFGVPREHRTDISANMVVLSVLVCDIDWTQVLWSCGDEGSPHHGGGGGEHGHNLALR
jgi:hypothetical protein